MHLLGDFVLQTKKMVLEKKRLKAAAWQLYVHCVLHGVLIYIIMPGWTLWQVPLIVSVSHFFIDWWKLNRRDTALYFIADQALHLLVLVLLWQWFFNSSTTGWYAILRAVLDSQRVWVVTAGYLLISFPLSYLLGYATQRWRLEAEQADAMRSSISLSEAGKWIGIFERLLVFTFVITHHFEGIGFLIAAKSILRFNDIKGSEARKEAEYVLIGTLMSFSASIMTGLVANLLLAA